MWAKVSTNQEDRQQYEDEAAELVGIAENAGKDADCLTVITIAPNTIIVP